MVSLKRMIGLAAVGCLGAMLALAAMGQQISEGIKGQVLGADGQPLANAEVVFTRTDVSGKFNMKTDKHGNYNYHTLPMGTFDVSVIPPGGSVVAVAKGVSTQLGAALVINANLKQMAEGIAGPPPGMTPEQAAAYEKKVKEQEDQTQKLGKLDALLQQNKQFDDAKQYDQAIAVMEQAVALDQTHDILYANLAEDYADAKQYDKAADAYQKAIALKPRNAGYVINLGTVLSKAGKVDEANAEFAKAAAMDPTQAKMAMYNSAVVLMNDNNMTAAAAAFDKLLAIDPDNADAWYEKAMCLLNQATSDPKTGKIQAPPGTAEALQKSIQLAPNGPNAANAKAALQTLGKS